LPFVGAALTHLTGLSLHSFCALKWLEGALGVGCTLFSLLQGAGIAAIGIAQISFDLQFAVSES
jgi:hypothetical protein